MGTRYSTPPVPTQYPYPGYTLPCRTVMPGLVTVPHGHVPEVNSVVGLKSVGQLSLCAVFSGFWNMTEVYNLVEVGRINNHYLIPGNK